MRPSLTLRVPMHRAENVKTSRRQSNKSTMIQRGIYDSNHLFPDVSS